MNAQVFPRVEGDPVGVRLAAGDFAFDWMSRNERFPFALALGGATALPACYNMINPRRRWPRRKTENSRQNDKTAVNI
jgi:hypothetical protein